MSCRMTDYKKQGTITFVRLVKIAKDRLNLIGLDSSHKFIHHGLVSVHLERVGGVIKSVLAETGLVEYFQLLTDQRPHELIDGMAGHQIDDANI